MKKVFMVHGFMGFPNGGFRPWLMDELNKKNIYACALPMPDPDYPEKSKWVNEIKHAVPEINEEIFLIGHSLGVPAILRYLEDVPEGVKIGGAVLISGPCSIIRLEDIESKIRRIDNFFDKDFNFKKIKESCKNFLIIHGENDDRVPLEHAKIISENLDCDLVIVPNGGHLNGSNGWKELPQALEGLLNMFK